MISLEILTMIISLCNVSALEDRSKVSRAKWTELAKVEKYQKECRVSYMDCYIKNLKANKKRSGNTLQHDHEAITKCIRDRAV